MKNQTTQWILIGIGAIVIIAGGWWVMNRNAAETTTDTSTSTASTSSNTNTGTATGNVSAGGTETSSTPGNAHPTTAAGGETISVNDQAAGGSVVIASANLSKSSWIAIKDANSRILGAARFDSLTVTNGNVPLLRATESGKIYYAVIYVDNGDKTFDFHTDMIVVSGDTPVNRSFLAK